MDHCNHGFGASYSGRGSMGSFRVGSTNNQCLSRIFLPSWRRWRPGAISGRERRSKVFTDSWTVYQTWDLRWALTPAMAALFRHLHWYSAQSDCFVGTAHIPGIENSGRTLFPRLTSPGSSNCVPMPPPPRPRSRNCLILTFSVNLRLQQLEVIAANLIDHALAP